MRLLRQWLLSAAVSVLLVLGSAALTPLPRLGAQNSGIALWDLGAQTISGTTWEFERDFSMGAGAWESLTISNYGYCWVGPNDPRAGTAHAGAVYWFAELLPEPPSGSGTVYTGQLQAERSRAAGEATIMTTLDRSGPLTHIHVTISGGDLTNFQDNTLNVCLLGSS